MKNKLVLSIATFSLVSSLSYAVEQDFTITSVGISRNTSSVFVDMAEASTESTCSNKNLARLSLQEAEANMFLSVALAAQAQGKKITLDLSSDQCLSGGAIVEIFKVKSET